MLPERRGEGPPGTVSICPIRMSSLDPLPFVATTLPISSINVFSQPSDGKTLLRSMDARDSSPLKLFILTRSKSSSSGVLIQITLQVFPPLRKQPDPAGLFLQQEAEENAPPWDRPKVQGFLFPPVSL